MSAINARHASTTGFEMHALEDRRLHVVDLTISSIVLHTNVLPTHEGTKASITIKNLGNTAAPAGVEMRLRFSEDDVFGNDDDWNLGYVKVNNPIGAGASITYEMERRASAQGTGFFRLIAFVDGFEDIAESNESNNIAMTAPDSVIYANDVDEGDLVGTEGNDVFTLRHIGDTAFVTKNDRVHQMPLAGLDQIFIDAGAGNDIVTAAPDFPVKMAVTGSGGRDLIVGGAGNDELSGATGIDKVVGGAGHDFILGGAQGDRLYGEAGDDLISGAGGNDFIFGGEGSNSLIAGAGNDRLFSKGNAGVDTLSGNTGDDTAEADATDLLAGVETTV